MSEEAMHEYVRGELRFSFRETLPMNWPALTLAGIRNVQNEFRRILRVD